MAIDQKKDRTRIETETDPEYNKQKEVRRRVENILAGRFNDPAQPSAREVEQLVLDIEIYRIELEMQNEELKRTQQLLEETRALYIDLYDLAPTAYITLDRAGIICQLNLTASDLLYGERYNMIGHPLSSYIAKEDLPKFRSHLTNCFSSGGSSFSELTLTRKNGERFFVHLSSTLAESTVCEKGREPMIRTIITDITERRRIEKDLLLTQLSVDKAVELIFWTDNKGHVLYVNQRACQVLGYSREEVLQNPIGKFLLEFPEQNWSIKSKQLKETCESPIESLSRTRDGRTLPLDVSITYLAHDEKEYFTMVSHDATKRKAEETALKEAKAFTDATLQAKNLFFASMSHEIRTPMNGVIGMTELLAETTLTREQQSLVQDVQSSAQCLLTTINDILDFSKAEAGKLSLHLGNFSLSGVISRVFSLLKVRASEKDIQLIHRIDSFRPETPIF